MDFSLAKKKLSLCLALAMVLGLVFGMLPVSAVPTAYVVNDDFESGVVSAGWALNKGNAATVTVSNDVYSTGRGMYSLKMEDNSLSTFPRIESTFAAQTGTVTVQFDVYATKTDSDMNIFVYANNTGSTVNQVAKVWLSKDGSIKAQNGTKTAVRDLEIITPLYDPNKWYNIKMVFDTNKQIYEVYLDGRLQRSNLAFNKALPAAASNVNRIAFANTTDSLMTTYLDNFQVYQGGQVLGEHYGADKALEATGDPLGGGAGYSRMVNPASADFIVNTLAELENALQAAAPGQIIYISDSAVIDITSRGNQSLVVPGGVTVASGRGNGSDGALIKTTYMSDDDPAAFYNGPDFAAKNKEKDLNGFFRTDGPNARITGLRLQGSQPKVLGEMASVYNRPLSIGIYSEYRVEVDNNEIYNFSYAGVKAGDAYIHHNNIHDTTRSGLGYGIIVGDTKVGPKSYVLAEGNIFDRFSHAIAGVGEVNDRYEARYNYSGQGTGHTYDMHNGVYFGNNRPTSPGQSLDLTEITPAGDWVRIHHNTIADTNLSTALPTAPDPLNSIPHNLIVIRGVSVNGTYINNNHFELPSKEAGLAILQQNALGNFYVGPNTYGAEKTKITGWADKAYDSDYGFFGRPWWSWQTTGAYPDLTVPKDPTKAIKYVTYTDANGNAITDLSQANGFIYVTAKVHSYNWKNYNITVISTLKDANGTPIQIGNYEISVDPIEVATVKFGFKLPADVTGLSIETTAWDNLNNMHPVMNNVKFPANY
jgi:hypothetical protein